MIEPRHCFPLELQKILVSRETNCARLVHNMTQRGYRISKQFLSEITRGKRRIPAQQLRRICEVLQTDENERRRLNKAACLDYGFDVGPLDA